MVEGARLESVCTGNRTKGSNPFLSASLRSRSGEGCRAVAAKPRRRTSPSPIPRASARPAIAGHSASCPHSRRLSRRSSEAAKADLLFRNSRNLTRLDRTQRLQKTFVRQDDLPGIVEHLLLAAGVHIVMCMGNKTIVYVLRSQRNPLRRYTGLTSDVDLRLQAHNAGQNVDTAYDRPWTLFASFYFGNERTARCFEKYLKSGSGRAFAKRHFDEAIPET